MEDLKKIEGFERYLISPVGKIFSLNSNKYLKPHTNPPHKTLLHTTTPGQKKRH